MRLISMFLLWIGLTIPAVAQQTRFDQKKKPSMTTEQLDQWAKDKGLDSITLGAGCFWCTEAAFQQIDGVEKVVSGYSGGHVENPTYEMICTKTTGHVEVARVFYDPKKVSLEQLLEVFFKIHDPTSMDKQGNDSGPQYRSAIFYHNDAQKKIVDASIKAIAQAFAPSKIVTIVEPIKNFYPAEDYHQNFYNNNRDYPYCQFIVREKVLKVQQAFKDLLKEDEK